MQFQPQQSGQNGELQGQLDSEVSGKLNINQIQIENDGGSQSNKSNKENQNKESIIEPQHSHQSSLLQIINIHLNNQNNQLQENRRIANISNTSLEQLEQMFCINQYYINSIKMFVNNILFDIFNVQILVLLIILMVNYKLNVQLILFYIIIVDIFRIFSLSYQYEQEYIDHSYKVLNQYHYVLYIFGEVALILYTHGYIKYLLIVGAVFALNNVQQIILIKTTYKDMKYKSKVMSVANEVVRLVILLQYLLFALKMDVQLSQSNWSVYFLPSIIVFSALGIICGFGGYLLVKQFIIQSHSKRKDSQIIKSIMWILLNASSLFIATLFFFLIITNYMSSYTVNKTSEFEHKASRTYYGVYIFPLLIVFQAIAHFQIKDDTIIFFGKVIFKQDFIYEDQQIRQAIESCQFSQIQKEKRDKYVVKEQKPFNLEFVAKASSSLFTIIKNPSNVESSNTKNKNNKLQISKLKPRANQQKNQISKPKQQNDKAPIQLININGDNNNIYITSNTNSNLNEDEENKEINQNKKEKNPECIATEPNTTTPRNIILNQSFQLNNNKIIHQVITLDQPIKSEQALQSEKSYKPENASNTNQEECCCICYQNQANTIIDQCFHGGICYQCGVDLLKQTGKCYLCRQERHRLFQYDSSKKTKDGLYPLILTTNIEEKQSSETESENQ